jgi:hypothetical protein
MLSDASRAWILRKARIAAEFIEFAISTFVGSIVYDAPLKLRRRLDQSASKPPVARDPTMLDYAKPGLQGIGT